MKKQFSVFLLLLLLLSQPLPGIFQNGTASAGSLMKSDDKICSSQKTPIKCKAVSSEISKSKERLMDKQVSSISGSKSKLSAIVIYKPEKVKKKQPRIIAK